jgi:Reverse transcriptase (RNA-dependent DNA polymerase)
MLYGLKQSPGAWNTQIDVYFKEYGFMQCPYEHALYLNLIFIKNNRDMIEKFKLEMTREFEMTDLGLMSYFLGLEVRHENSKIFVSQEVYAKKILKKFKMNECNHFG